MLNRLVVFSLGEQSYALSLRAVLRVVRMVELTPLPRAPEIVLGVIDVQEEIVPVMSMRKRFGLAEPEISLRDQLIVADTTTRRVALVVTSVTGVVERREEDIITAAQIVPGLQCVDGISRLEDGLLFIHDLDLFLSQKEEQQLDGLLACGATTESATRGSVSTEGVGRGSAAGE
ncbi:MAG: chemotaxis protein CheW [Candidatus Sulfotelmatobacter sp.]